MATHTATWPADYSNYSVYASCNDSINSKETVDRTENYGFGGTALRRARTASVRLKEGNVMSHATFITVRRIVLTTGLLVALSCGTRTAKGDDPSGHPNGPTYARQVDELGMMVRQMQDPRNPALVPTSCCTFAAGHCR